MTQHTTRIGRIARRTSLVALGLLVTATGTAAAHGSGSYGGMMGGGGGLFGGTMGLWGLLWMGLLLAIPAYLVYTFLGRDRPDQPTKPLAVLRERYARGEISEEEFDRRRDRLERTG